MTKLELGKVGATKAADAVAIAGLSVKTNVLNARILAGYDRSLTALNPDASIGAISVGDGWAASSVAAGVKDTTNDGFGRNDALIGGDTTPTIFATITSITIKGNAGGSFAGGDFFGLTAQKIGKVSIHGAAILPTGTDTLLDSTRNDFHLVTL